MPEGDTLFKLAATLRPRLVGRTVTDGLARVPGPKVEALTGAVVESVGAAGKHLLIGFDRGLTLHVHLGMYGRCFLAPRARPFRPGERVRLVLGFGEEQLVCRDTAVTELVRTKALAVHQRLTTLGPDLLSPDFDLDEAIRRFEGVPGERIADALLNQRLMAGVGNVYKSEVLFCERVHPHQRVGDLGVERLTSIILRAKSLLEANRTTYRRRTAPGGATGERHWVYGRAGRPCGVCGTLVSVERLAPLGRSTYWCAKCQPLVDGGELPDRAVEAEDEDLAVGPAGEPGDVGIAIDE